jgi:hypothetical protein
MPFLTRTGLANLSLGISCDFNELAAQLGVRFLAGGHDALNLRIGRPIPLDMAFIPAHN